MTFLFLFLYCSQLMTEAGYHYESFPNKIEFVWLLKKKHSDVLS